MGEKLTFVNFMEKITDGLAKIIFRQDVMGMWWVFWSSYSSFTVYNKSTSNPILNQITG